MSHPAVTDIGYTAVHTVFQEPWLGNIKKPDIYKWIDNFLLLVSTPVTNHGLPLTVLLYKLYNCKPTKQEMLNNYFLII